jgi:hypothetical protein
LKTAFVSTPSVENPSDDASAVGYDRVRLP